MSSKTQLRAAARQAGAAPRPGSVKQTHSVFHGKFRYPGYVDGNHIRSLVTGDVLASKSKTGWDCRVEEVNIPEPIRALPIRWEPGSVTRGRFF